MIVYFLNLNSMEETKKKNVWGIVLKVIITVATALAGVFGIASCVGR